MNSNSDISKWDGAEGSPLPEAGRASQPPSAPPVRLGGLLLLVIILLAAGLLAGFVPRWKSRKVLGEENRELSLPTVNVVSVAPAKAPAALRLSGEIKPLIDAAIYARASGYVRRWLVDLGAQVEAGQLLAELDMPEVGRQLAQARAELAQAEAASALAKTTAKRWRDMLAGKTVSAQEADEKAGDLALKTATSEAAAANVHRIEELTAFGEIRAPFAGTITARRIDVGQLVSAGSGQELFHLGQTSRLRVFVRIPQAFARSVAPGQTAVLTLAELPGRDFEARVVRTAGAFDATSRTLLTELEVDNAKGEIFAGGYVQVQLPDAKTQASATLPSNTLLFRPEGPQVAVVLDGSRVTLRGVTLGRDFGTVVEILSGLSPADKVIINPADSLVEGAEVRLAAPPAS